MTLFVHIVIDAYFTSIQGVLSIVIAFVLSNTLYDSLFLYVRRM